jgi:hypothetical protein
MNVTKIVSVNVTLLELLQTRGRFYGHVVKQVLLLNDFTCYYYYYLVCEAIGTVATPGLLCQSWVMVKMILEKQIECRLAGETEVLGENLSQRHFCPSQNPT